MRPGKASSPPIIFISQIQTFQKPSRQYLYTTSYYTAAHQLSSQSSQRIAGPHFLVPPKSESMQQIRLRGISTLLFLFDLFNQSISPSSQIRSFQYPYNIICLVTTPPPKRIYKADQKVRIFSSDLVYPRITHKKNRRQKQSMLQRVIP